MADNITTAAKLDLLRKLKNLTELGREMKAALPNMTPQEREQARQLAEEIAQDLASILRQLGD